MAVRTIGAMYTRFIGLSTDDKPMDVSDGAEFLSINTGERWDFFDGVWILNLATAALPQRIFIDFRGTWQYPYVYGNGLAYEWFDDEVGFKRLKIGAAPTSIDDGEMIPMG